MKQPQQAESAIAIKRRESAIPSKLQHSTTMKSLPFILTLHCSSAFVQQPSPHGTSTQLYHWANRLDNRFSQSTEIVAENEQLLTRRSLFSIGIAATTTYTTLLSPLVANADFAPGGTLLDREVSIFYGNPEASPSRKSDNSNVIFSQDNYYKFGAAAQWIPAGNTDFPKTVPFVLSQQRYDALKKYGSRIKGGVDVIANIGGATSASDVPDMTDPMYQLRGMGLLANSFLASENTGTTNELMLARWYINETYLRIGDYKSALERGDAKDAKACYEYLKKAVNSYLTLMNRSITSKVGDPFSYVT